MRNPKAFKKLVRERMTKTGEKYTAAMAALSKERDEAWRPTSEPEKTYAVPGFADAQLEDVLTDDELSDADAAAVTP